MLNQSAGPVKATWRCVSSHQQKKLLMMRDLWSGHGRSRPPLPQQLPAGLSQLLWTKTGPEVRWRFSESPSDMKPSFLSSSRSCSIISRVTVRVLDVHDVEWFTVLFISPTFQIFVLLRCGLSTMAAMSFVLWKRSIHISNTHHVTVKIFTHTPLWLDHNTHSDLQITWSL